ncbi:prepilin peptidase [Staphylococcus shinii]|uniref:prepilin peptidase n=1 Tax=Staphylococcus shinii TaxID=2912228 RepID=UPI0030B865B8
MLVTLLLIYPILFSFLYQLCFVEKLELSYLTLRSRCDDCLKEIRLLELIPVLSFIFLRGTSSCCNRKINIFYLIGELLSLIPLFYIFYVPHNLIDNATLLLIYLFLLVLAIYDLKTYTVPLHVIVVFAICICFITPLHIMSFLFVTSLLHVFYILFHNAIGYGDIIIFSLLALALPSIEFSIILLFTFICGGLFALFILLVFHNESSKIPLIPFIYLAFNITLLTYQNFVFGGF